MESAEDAITRRVAEAGVRVRRLTVEAAVTASKLKVLAAVGWAAARAALPPRPRDAGVRPPR
ncbi:hypothetical protein GCM10027258_67460 [Amycolatopsis stemonae]